MEILLISLFIANVLIVALYIKYQPKRHDQIPKTFPTKDEIDELFTEAKINSIVEQARSGAGDEGTVWDKMIENYRKRYVGEEWENAERPYIK